VWRADGEPQDRREQQVPAQHGRQRLTGGARPQHEEDTDGRRVDPVVEIARYFDQVGEAERKKEREQQS
jgi:hypothetical protein